MKIRIEEINSGRYNLLNNFLIFDCKEFGYLKEENEPLKPTHIELMIDKTSALEIMHTLLDSENLLTKENEKLICDIDERINGELND